MCASDVVVVHTQNYRSMTLVLPVLKLTLLQSLTIWHNFHMASDGYLCHYNSDVAWRVLVDTLLMSGGRHWEITLEMEVALKID